MKESGILSTLSRLHAADTQPLITLNIENIPRKSLVVKIETYYPGQRPLWAKSLLAYVDFLASYV